MNIWVLVKIEDRGGIITVDPLGVYAKLSLAVAWVGKLEELNINKRDVCFDVIDFKMNADPTCFTHMVNDREQLIDSINDSIQSLIRKGWVESFVEEDGRFSYELTEKGRAFMKGIPGQKIKKFLRDNT